MHNENVGVLELRRNLSALLETTTRHPLMVHRYGAPWVCVLSDLHWRQHAALLEFMPQRHPLASLLQLQRQHMPLEEGDGLSLAATARALLLQAIHAIDGLALLHDQVRHHRLWHWFVAGGGAVMEYWKLDLVRARVNALVSDQGVHGSLRAFAQRDDVVALALRCGGYVPRFNLDARQDMSVA